LKNRERRRRNSASATGTVGRPKENIRSEITTAVVENNKIWRFSRAFPPPRDCEGLQYPAPVLYINGRSFFTNI